MTETAQFNTTTLIVDDTSNLIEYSAGWTAGFSGSGVSDDDAEYMRTKHGTSSAGRTVKFSFTGTSVAVYGSLGSVDVYGVPVSSYSVDGGNTATYTAPIIEPGGFLTHVAFYQSPSLAPGAHELVITNLNGTAPSVLWLDFILYNPSQSTGVTGGGATTGVGTSSPYNAPTTSPSSSPTSSPPSSITSSSSSTAANASSITLPTSSGTTSAGSSIASTGTSSLTFSAGGSSTFGGPVTVATADTSSLSTSKHTSAGAIVGGVIGGIAALALLSAFLFLCYRRRRRQQIGPHEPTPTTPFRYKGSDQDFFVSPFADPEERSRANVLPIKRIASFSASPGSIPTPGNPSSNRTSSVPHTLDPSATPTSMSTPAIVRHTDSGIRLPTPVEVPPEYTQN